MCRFEKNAQKLKMSNNYSWSDWLDLNENIISNIPKNAGVYSMHLAMKILFIEGTENLQESIQEKLKHPEISENTRVKFMKTASYESITNDLIKDYKNRHDGKLPLCMK